MSFGLIIFCLTMRATIVVPPVLGGSIVMLSLSGPSPTVLLVLEIILSNGSMQVLGQSKAKSRSLSRKFPTLNPRIPPLVILGPTLGLELYTTAIMRSFAQNSIYWAQRARMQKVSHGD